MPVTRSSSRQDSQQPSSQPYSSSRRASSSGSGDTKKKTSKTPSNEIIVLSSDDDEPQPKGTLSIKKASSSRSLRKKPSASAAPPVLPTDILEISSDEELEIKTKKRTARKQTQSSEKKNKDLEGTVKRLQEDVERYKQQVEDIKRDGATKHGSTLPLCHLPFMSSNSCVRQVLPALEEYISCEVCAETLWCPYILPDCGHSFCETCLSDWFSTIQAQHITANPQLEDNRAALSGHIQTLLQMVPNLHAYGPHGQTHIRAVLAELRRHRPEYTCPSCRKAVLNKPTEDFRLKGLVKEIAAMVGETDTRKIAPSQPGAGPFDHFFAAPITPG